MKSEKAVAVTSTAAAPMSAADLRALGEELLAQQRAIREKIPDFTMPHPKRLPLSGPAARVTDVAIKEGLAICESHPLLAQEVDVAEVQYAEDYERALTNLRDEMANCLAGLDYTIRAKRHKNGETMLRVMGVADTLARRPDNAALRVPVAAMKKAFRTHRRASETPTDTPSTPPTPQS